MHKKKFYGQHFLKDEAIVQAILDAAKPEGENILEIGPGAGALTKELTKWSKTIVAVDIDKEAIDTTRKEIDTPKLRLIERDVLKLEDEEIANLFNNEEYVLVGNLPYNITSDILKKFVPNSNGPKKLIVMVQKEVAERIMALAGEMNMLALTVQFFMTVKPVINVKKEAFDPPPRVDSAVINLERISSEIMKARNIDDPEKFFRFANVAFSKKRKQLKSTLTALTEVEPRLLENALEEIHHKSTARPQELSLNDWIELYKILHK